MRRSVTMLALTVCATTPAAAQWAGMPVWNNPKGGTGVTISGDYGSNNEDGGGGSAFGGRVSVGLANLTLEAGLASWDQDDAAERVTSFGATAGFRIIGGSLLPVAMNFLVGAGRSSEFESRPIGTPPTAVTMPAATRVIGAVGFSASVPTPGLSIEPYASLGIRYSKLSDAPAGADDSDSNFGWTIGANLSFGMLGVHLAYDSENVRGPGTAGIFGVGAHVALRAPVGL